MKQKGKLKRIVIFCLCVIGITAATVLAVSKNSEEEVKNTFTYGEVKITLSEEKYDRLSNAAKVMAPLSKIDKDPVVVNTGKNDAVVFIKVEIPKALVDTVGDVDDGHGGVTPNQKIHNTEKVQLFNLITTVGGNDTTGVNDNWKLVSKDQTGSDVNTYVYGYTKVIAKDEKTAALFDKIQLINILETDSLSGSVGNINVYAYAIQADNILINNQKVTNAQLAHSVADGSETVYDNLVDIYNKYVNQ